MKTVSTAPSPSDLMGTKMPRGTIVFEQSGFYVLDTKSRYEVYKPGLTHATSNTAFAHDAYGLSLAIAMCKYGAKYNKHTGFKQ